MNTYSQRGMSKLALIIILAVVGFFGLAASRLVPVYTDNYYIQQGLASLQDLGVEVGQMTDREIIGHLSRFFSVNNIRSQNAKDAEIVRDEEQILVYFDYEVRVHLMYNIDVVMTFENLWDSRRPSECCDGDGQGE